MTVLDFDPPQPALRLVSSTGSATARDHRYRDGAALHGPVRDLYRDVLQSSLVWQKPVDADALRVVLATKQNSSASPARAFSASMIWQLMFVDVVAWCRNRHLKVPSGCSTALVRVVEHLEATDSFHELSDPAVALFDAIDECTGGWSDDSPASTAPTESTTPESSGSSTTRTTPSTPSRSQGSLRFTRGSQRT